MPRPLSGRQSGPEAEMNPGVYQTVHIVEGLQTGGTVQPDKHSYKSMLATRK